MQVEMDSRALYATLERLFPDPGATVGKKMDGEDQSFLLQDSMHRPLESMLTVNDLSESTTEFTEEAVRSIEKRAGSDDFQLQHLIELPKSVSSCLMMNNGPSFSPI